MNDERDRTSRTSAGTQARAGNDFQSAVERLEKAVDELVGTARDQLSDKATAFIDETTTRLEMEIGRRKDGRSSRAHRSTGRLRGGESREAHRSQSQLPPVTARTRKLYRDPQRGKIGGVCAGIAAYYGAEPWVVRCIAVTGLLFLPSIVFPAYVIAYFLMDKPPAGNGEVHRRRYRDRHNHSSPSPELGPQLSPRNSLRDVQADLTEAELRLRRMESHVTSGQFELHRELNKIDGDDGVVRPQGS